MGPVIAMLIGIIGTSVIHSSKGVMKLGMQRLQHAHAVGGSKRGASFVYSAGMIANFTTPFWVMFANLFAPTVFYTSMYGLGLISLLIFSRLVLREDLNRGHITGAAIIIGGTGLLGVGEFLGTPPVFGHETLAPLVTISVIWVFVGLTVAACIAGRKLLFQEIFFGLSAGGMAALDAMLKGFAQQGEGGSTFIPTTALGGIVLAGSFLPAAGAFGMIQWSYLRFCRVSIMGTTYDLSYVGLPVLLSALLDSGYGLTPFNTAGLVLLVSGALIVQRAGNPILVPDMKDPAHDAAC